MSRNVRTCAGGLALAFLAVLPAWGQTFSYSENFDSVTGGAKPPGWWTGCLDDATKLPGLATMDPVVLSADPAGYGALSALTTGRGYAANAGEVNYAVPWSGAKRFTIAHPAWGTNARASEAWYIGTGGPHTGTYPLDLKHNSFKAEFDLAMRTGRSNVSTHNFTFAVQPALDGQDFMHYGYAFGRGGWGMNGFCVEVDLFINDAGLDQGNGFGDPPRGALVNGNTLLPAHVGVNVQRMWDVLGYGVQSLKTNVEQGVAIPWNPMPTTDTALAQSPWVAPGNNNQPLHFTVYYNDAAHGGAGQLQVYLKVKAADKDANDPAVPVGQAAYSFGEDPGDPAEGKLMIDVCMGPWPGDGAVFGFTDGYSGSNHIAQVDNIKVQTNQANTGNPCVPTYPAPDPGVTVVNVTLADSSVVRRNAPEFSFVNDITGTGVTVNAAPTQSSNAGLTQPGWAVYTYPDLSSYWNNTPILDFFEKSIAYCDQTGLNGPAVTGEPDINYYDYGSGGNNTVALFRRTMPGMAQLNNEWFGILAKAWAYFPPDTDGTNPYPRHYNFCVGSDNGARLRIGGENVLDSGNDGLFRGFNTYHQNTPPGTVGINAGWFRDVTINAPGVYPIQLMFNERWGGAYVEFYRRTDNAMAAFLPVGTSKGGMNDQPIVFGLLNGQAPPTMLDPANTASDIPAVALDANQRVGDVNAATGDQVFTCKTVWAPKRWHYEGEADWTPEQVFAADLYYGIDTDGRTIGLRWLDVLQDRSGGATLAQIRNGNNGYMAELGGDIGGIPGVPTTATAGTDATQFAFRADGYIVFPAAGAYWLGVVSEEHSWLRIGAQTLWTTEYFDQPGKVFRLDVPQAGTYPIRVELVKGANRGNQHLLRLYEAAPGKSKVLVNGPGSRLKVYSSCTNPYTWPANGTPIAASRKLAEAGQGGVLGWNGLAAKVANPQVYGGAEGAYDLYDTAHSTAVIENNLYYYGPETGGGPVNSGVTDTDTPVMLNYWDDADITDWYCCENMVAGTNPRFFDSKRLWQNFGPNGVWVAGLPGSGNEQRATSFTGYIEFPQAGDYAVNISVEDTGMMWIAGQVVSLRGWTSGWPVDSQPAIVHVSAPGIYDIRVDFFEQYWNALLATFEYLPDGTPVLINDPASRVKVYRTLAAGVNPSSTDFANPTKLLAKTKAGALGLGGDPGFHAQVAKCVYTNADGNRGAGHENFWTLEEAHALLAEVFDGVPAPNEAGTAVFDGTVNRLAFSPGAWDDFPGLSGDPGDWIAVRVNGYLGLKKGGHIFSLYCDDGASFKLGGQTWTTGPVKGGRWQDACYFNVPEDGLYPFEIEYMEIAGGNSLHLIEITNPTKVPWNSNFNGWEFVNDGNTVTKAYVNIAPCYPRADADADGDVDQADFGLFQICFTGQLPPSEPLTFPCKCFDRQAVGQTGNGSVDMNDLTEFMNCVTGPGVPWETVKGLLPNCKP